jgi:hypothetical protein
MASFHLAGGEGVGAGEDEDGVVVSVGDVILQTNSSSEISSSDSSSNEISSNGTDSSLCSDRFEFKYRPQKDVYSHSSSIVSYFFTYQGTDGLTGRWMHVYVYVYVEHVSVYFEHVHVCLCM